MKKLIIMLMLGVATSTSFAKKVKFACDMTGIPVLATGMHVSGDFQTVAGFAGGDWNSASTPLTQEPGTDIYSIVVDIPAFTKYEYKFVNGDQFYEAEFVPEYSRVMYNFNDNRWLYVDSLADDTTFVGAIIFGGNAPAGLKLARFYVDVQNVTVSPSGIHLMGSFQGFNPASTIMYSFGGTVYEIIAYMAAGTYEYKFINGNSGTGAEVIPGICSVNSNREVAVVDDMLLNPVCFGECSWCTTGIAENSGNAIHLYPNPASSKVNLELGSTLYAPVVKLRDVTGRTVREYQNINSKFVVIERESLKTGVYFVSVEADNYQPTVQKLIFE